MITEFPAEFVMELRMTMSNHSFYYWFGNETEHIFGYVKVMNCPDLSNVIVYNNEQYMKVSYNKNDSLPFSIRPVYFQPSTTFCLLKGDVFDFKSGKCISE